MNFLLQPKKYKSLAADAGSRAIMDKTIAFFEHMGKTRLTEDFNRKVWYRGFVDFIAREQIFAKLLTPRAYAGGDPDCRWDTARNSEYSELLAFYGLGYWYCFQVSILGLGPIWMSANEAAKRRAAEFLKQGAIFAFGLSERAHGADIYATETALTPREDGTWVTAVEQVGIPVGRPQTVLVDLAGVLGPSRRARVVTTMRVYWDAASAAAPAPEVALEPVALDPARADLGERGFSAVATDGEPLGFDYARVSWLSPWKTMPGRYTREGDVLALLAGADDRYVVSKPGDEVALSFDALRDPGRGRARTFLLHGVGYSKEMDINSASPDVVLPLPYHGMRSYPYADAEAPEAARKAALAAEEWNTRLVVRPITPIELFAAGR